MKIMICGVSVLFSLYVGAQSFVIARTGATYHISQLEGDGGGGFLIAFLCLVAGLLVLLRYWLSAAAFLTTAAAAILVGLVYQDPTTRLWAIAPVTLGLLALVVQYRQFRIARSRKVTETHRRMVRSD